MFSMLLFFSRKGDQSVKLKQVSKWIHSHLQLGYWPNAFSTSDRDSSSHRNQQHGSHPHRKYDKYQYIISNIMNDVEEDLK